MITVKATPFFVSCIVAREMAFYSALFVVVAFVDFTVIKGESVLPQNRNCDPLLNNCQKGDWFASSIADCCYTGAVTCDAINDGWWDETVDLAVGDKCQPCGGQYRFNCGEYGTNSRCVCDDVVAYDPFGNRCKCQYWPQVTPPTEPPHTESTTSRQEKSTTAERNPTTKPSQNNDQTTEPPHHWSDGLIAAVVAAAVAGTIFFIFIVIVVIFCAVSKRHHCKYNEIQ